MCRHPSSRLLALSLATALLVLPLLAVSPALAQEEPTPPPEEEAGHPCDDLARPLRPSCRLAAGAVEAGGAVVGGAIATGAEAALQTIVEWVVGGAAWLLGQLVGLIDSSTRPDVTQGWFSVAYRDMATIAVLLMLPLLLVSAIQAVLRQSVAHVAKAAFVYVPVAAVGMFAAVAVVDQLVLITDELTGWIGRLTGANLTVFAENVGNALVATGVATGDPAGGAALPGFAALLAAGVIGFASFVIWVLLVLRQAAIYVAVLFLPLAFAALVWPATAHWLRRLLEGLVAVIMSKFVIVAVMALASGALNAIAEEGFAVLVSGGALLLMAAFAPFVLLRLIPVFEAGLANQLEGTTNTRTSPVPAPTAGGVYRGVQQARAASAARGAGRLAAAGGGTAAMAGAGAATAGVGLVAAGAGRAAGAVSQAARQTAEVAAAAGRGDGTSNGDGPGRASGNGRRSAADSAPPVAAPAVASKGAPRQPNSGAAPAGGGSSAAPAPARPQGVSAAGIDAGSPTSSSRPPRPPRPPAPPTGEERGG